METMMVVSRPQESLGLDELKKRYSTCYPHEAFGILHDMPSLAKGNGYRQYIDVLTFLCLVGNEAEGIVCEPDAAQRALARAIIVQKFCPYCFEDRSGMTVRRQSLEVILRFFAASRLNHVADSEDRKKYKSFLSDCIHRRRHLTISEWKYTVISALHYGYTEVYPVDQATVKIIYEYLVNKMCSEYPDSMGVSDTDAVPDAWQWQMTGEHIPRTRINELCQKAMTMVNDVERIGLCLFRISNALCHTRAA